jgi:predicted dinucleotide-binding enzyme
MRIAIIGAGMIGGTVGTLLAKAGHEVLFASRHPEQLASLVRSLPGGARTGSPLDAAKYGEAVLVSVPLKAIPALGTGVGALLAGKTVLDTSNPYADRDGLEHRSV